jgi:hypothetical protein
MAKIKGIEIADLTIGTGAEATKENVVVVNVRTFLRRGDEVASSPIFGLRNLIDLSRRDAIAGLLYGIPGMRVGGVRQILISPHLAYGDAGIPGRIPANALLRCQVELLEIRQDNALLPEDYLPGQILHFAHPGDADGEFPSLTLDMHEDGNSLLHFVQKSSTSNPKQDRYHAVPITISPQGSRAIIQEAMDLPTQANNDCLLWDSDLIETEKGGVVRDRKSRARCIVVHVMDRGEKVRLYAVPESSQSFLNSTFYKAIESLIHAHLVPEPPPITP